MNKTTNKIEFINILKDVIEVSYFSNISIHIYGWLRKLKLPNWDKYFKQYLLVKANKTRIFPNDESPDILIRLAIEDRKLLVKPYLLIDKVYLLSNTEINSLYSHFISRIKVFDIVINHIVTAEISLTEMVLLLNKYVSEHKCSGLKSL